MNLIITIALLFLTLTQTGCSTITARNDLAELQKARLCCKSVEELPSPVALKKEQTINFSATTPHYDFGNGLAPFAVFKVPPTVIGRKFEVLAIPRHSDRTYGGDGSEFYADLKIIFLGAGPDTTPIPFDPSSTSFRHYGWSTIQSSLSRLGVVPPGAERMIVMTSPKSIGQTVSLGTVGPMTVKIGTAFITTSSHERFYHLSPYGEVTLLFPSLDSQ